MTKQRITLISLVGVLFFGLLLGGQILYKKNWVDAGILNQSLQIPGVVSAKLVEVNGQPELDVVTSQIKDLHQAALKLEKVAGKHPIRFRDQRNEDLEKLLDQMQFALQEGITRGNFTEMAQTIKEQAMKNGAQLDLAMDNEAIYLTLNKGEAQLVEVLERHDQGRFLPGEKQ